MKASPVRVPALMGAALLAAACGSPPAGQEATMTPPATAAVERPAAPSPPAAASVETATFAVG